MAFGNVKVIVVKIERHDKEYWNGGPFLPDAYETLDFLTTNGEYYSHNPAFLLELPDVAPQEVFFDLVERDPESGEIYNYLDHYEDDPLEITQERYVSPRGLGWNYGSPSIDINPTLPFPITPEQVEALKSADSISLNSRTNLVNRNTIKRIEVWLGDEQGNRSDIIASKSFPIEDAELFYSSEVVRTTDIPINPDAFPSQVKYRYFFPLLEKAQQYAEE